jgi:hypothetical protein
MKVLCSGSGYGSDRGSYSRITVSGVTIQT